MFAPHRARIIGTRHMAAAGHYLAAQTALNILEVGGNAIDAGVAGGIALNVVQSEYVGFGGVAPIMIYLADRDEVITISGLGPWPKATKLEVFLRDHGGRIPASVLQTVVPAAPDAWITALERYGTMSYGDVAAAALHLARDGFPAPSLMCQIAVDHEKEYRRWEANAAIYLPNGRPPSPGDVFVQSDLARVIQYMIDEESAASAKGGRLAGLAAARRAFYRGDIAQAMVRYNAENGGWLTAEDLAEFRSDVEPALKVYFAGAEIYSCGPWCQGPTLSQTLAMLDGTDLVALGHNTPAYIHHLVEVLKLAYADRQHYYGDPKFVDVPIAELLSAEYARERRKNVDPKRAYPTMPPAGIVRGGAPKSFVRANAGHRETADQLDTSYVCVVDSAGNACSATPSDAAASGPVIPGLGFVPSTRGTQSWTDPSVPAVLAPGKRPRLTPSPGFARKRGEWIMPIGSPGNDVQIQAILQALLNVIVWGMAPQQAVEEPRFATFSYPRSSAPHSYDPGLMKVERRISADTREKLQAFGHTVGEWPEWEWRAGAVCTILADQRRGTMEGGADPRRPTGVVGW